MLKLGISRKTFYYCILAAIVLFGFRLPLHTPSERLYFLVEALFFVMLLVWLLVDLAVVIVHEHRLHRLDLLMLLLLLLPLIGTLTAWIYFQQPLFFGLVAQRSYLCIIAPILLGRLLRRGSVSISMVRRVWLLMAAGTVIYWCLVEYVVGPARYAAMGGSVSMNALRGARFRYEYVLSGFWVVYLGIRCLRQTTWLNGALLLGALWYVFAVTKSRLFAVSVVAALSLFVFEDMFAVRGRALKYAFGGAVVLVLLSFLFCLRPDISDYMNASFYSAFRVVLTGELTGEGSANARIHQTALVWPHILAHPWFGSGAISKQWEFSFAELMGGGNSKFAPKDVGILGGLFKYGLVGVTLWFLPYGYCLNRWHRIGRHSQDLFALACKYTIIHLLVLTLLSNAGLQMPTPGLLIIVIMAFMVRPEETADSGSAKAHGIEG
jgi:hypothetical protein